MSKNRGLLIALALVVAVLFAAPATAQEKFMYATGKMFQGANITFGQMFWGPNQVRLRDAVAGWYITDAFGTAAEMLPSSPTPVDPRIAGPVIDSINCNLDAVGWQGECWGTMEMTVGDGGWAGTWSGKFDLRRYIAKFSYTGHGTGTFAGKELKLDGMGPAKEADFYFLAEVINP